MKDYFAWKKALWSDEILRKLAAKSNLDIRATAEVVTLFGKWGTGCRPAMATVAKMIGCVEKTVRTHCDELVSLGWLTAEKRKGQTTVYSITHPGNQDYRGSEGNLGNEDYRGTPVIRITDDQSKNQGDGVRSVRQPDPGGVGATRLESPPDPPEEPKHHLGDEGQGGTPECACGWDEFGDFVLSVCPGHRCPCGQAATGVVNRFTPMGKPASDYRCEPCRQELERALTRRH